MYLCLAVALLGLLAFGICIRKGRQKEHGIYFLIIMISGIFGVMVCLGNTEPEMMQTNGIERPEPGSDALEKDYVLAVEDLSIREPYRVTVENRHLTKKELEELFTQAAEELERTFLDRNESLDCITHNVVLADRVMDGRVAVSWSFDDYKAVNLSGELQEEGLTEQGTLVHVTATLEYEEAQTEVLFSMMVYPPQKTVEEQFHALLAQELQTRNTYTDAVFMLPQKVQGHTLVWTKRQQKKHYTVLLIGLCAIAGVAVGRKEDIRKEKERRDQRLLADYPQMLSQMALLLGAGMTVSHAWERMVISYENRCTEHGGKLLEIPVYEEMRITYHQMKDGLGERLAYEQFGDRIGLQVYRRLATLLVQNLRKGTAGLSKLLEKEMQNAYDAQESDAKKRGEELQTKLLLPMMLMLGLVIVIIMIPAIISFGM